MNGVDFEHYSSGKDLLLIITGIGGTTAGYMNKYKKIAESAVSERSLSVFIATCPNSLWERTQDVMLHIMQAVLNILQPDGKIYAMGNSAGATLLLWYAKMFPEIKRVLAVNPVMNINLHRAVDGVKNFSGEKIHIVSGEMDSSAFYLQIFKNCKIPEVTLLEEVDHNFTGKLPQFISLPEKFLFD